MKLEVIRISSESDSTSGLLFDVTDEKKFLCYTLEDEHRKDVKKLRKYIIALVATKASARHFHSAGYAKKGGKVSDTIKMEKGGNIEKEKDEIIERILKHISDD